MQSERLAQQLGTLPANPGIYLFRDKNDKVIYVGKAASLSSRVRSYFGASRSLSSKAQRLTSSISTMEFIITNSEAEALLLECNMIKKYHPRFNVRFRDDKAFP
ncbi:MAG: GIY-YIG nuclease family protein, partial [Dehalococcoidia bacterium]|nr:GIY-YIG nuclease family protein [Dehalococcoidia bacterium]